MPRNHKLSLEPLEQRNLLTVVVQDGILGIRGTKLDDTIVLQQSLNQFQLDFNYQRSFINVPSNLRAIVIDRWDGNDSIRVDDSINTLTIVVGGKGSDFIKGGSGQNYLYGDAGNDAIVGGGQRNSSDTIDGGAGDDSIHLGDGGGTATGGKGNDSMYSGRSGGTLLGGAGNDELNADPTVTMLWGNVLTTGNTVLDGGSGNDSITGGTGSDDIRGGAGNDTLKGAYNNDRLDGGAGNDAIYGDEGSDWCAGGAGNDILFGGDGNDVLFGDAGIDQLYGELGNDEFHGGAGNDILGGAAGNDSLNGDAGNDQIFGDAGTDNIEGGKGNDDCHGGADDDQLNGGPGLDKLDGDGGNNLFESDSSAESPANGLQASLDSEVYAFLSSPSIGGGWADVHFEVTNDNGAVMSTFSVRANLGIWTGINPILNANTDFTMIIDGNFVGKVTTDSQGMVDVVFSSNPTGNELPMPLGFPTLHAGMKMQIENNVSGTFVHKIYL